MAAACRPDRTAPSTNSNYITGPTTVDGLNYRLDTTFSHADGFRDLGKQDYEVRPELSWHVGDHTLTFASTPARSHQTPDSYGLIYLNGSPITGVSTDAKYSTPFAFANQDYIRPTLTDKWDVNDFLTINNRFSYTHRDIDVMRNGDSTSTNGRPTSTESRSWAGNCARRTIPTATSTISSNRCGSSAPARSGIHC